MKLHLHWFKRGPVIGPMALSWNGTFAWQRFTCRCGVQEDRYGYVPPMETRRRVQQSLPVMPEPPQPPSGPGGASPLPRRSQ